MQSSGGVGSTDVSPSSSRGGGKHNSSGSLVDWDIGLSFSTPEGSGVSACEHAGYVFGGQEQGVRGKAGTPGFWAPEMLYYERDGKGRRYGPAADWWSFGCLIFALLAAKGPFTVLGGDTADDNAATLQNEPEFNPATFSPKCLTLLKGLLEKDPKFRLGCGPGGIDEVMQHPFFAGIDWVAIKNKQVVPPFKPKVNVLDSSKAVRGWTEKDKAKLHSVVLSSPDQVSQQRAPGWCFRCCFAPACHHSQIMANASMIHDCFAWYGCRLASRAFHSCLRRLSSRR